MNHTTRTFSRLFAALCSILWLAALLAACAPAGDPEQLFGSPAPTAQGQGDGAGPDAAALPGSGAEPGYPYGNMQKNAPSGNFMPYQGQIVFLSNDLAYTYDPATGAVSLLCRDATCSHLLCVAGTPWTNLESYDGTLYAMVRGWYITALKNGSFETISDGAVYSFWHANGLLYARTQDSSLVVFEPGSDTPRILIDEYTAIWNVVFGNYLYGSTGQGAIRIDLTADEPKAEIIVPGDVTPLVDGEHIYYVAGDGCFYRCELDGSAPLLLCEQNVLPASWNYDEDYLYFRFYDDSFFEGEDTLGHTIYRMSKSDPGHIEPLAEFPDTVYQIYLVPGCDQLFVTRHATDGIYLVEKQSGEVTELDLPEC